MDRSNHPAEGNERDVRVEGVIELSGLVKRSAAVTDRFGMQCMIGVELKGVLLQDDVKISRMQLPPIPSALVHQSVARGIAADKRISLRVTLVKLI